MKRKGSLRLSGTAPRGVIMRGVVRRGVLLSCTSAADKISCPHRHGSTGHGWPGVIVIVIQSLRWALDVDVHIVGVIPIGTNDCDT